MPPTPPRYLRLRRSRGALRRQENVHVRCFPKYVRYFTKQLKTLFYLHSSSTNLISQKFSDSPVILAVISVSKHCTLDLSIAAFLFFLQFFHSRKIFNDYFVTASVDFRVAFSIKLLSSSAFLGFRNVLFG